MRSFSLTLTDTNLHNLKTALIAAGYNSPDEIFEFREVNYYSDSGNGAKKIYLGGSDLNIATPKFSKMLIAGESYRRAPVNNREWLGAIYIQLDAQPATLHLDCTP